MTCVLLSWWLCLFAVCLRPQGLRMFPALIIVPSLQICWTLFSILSGMLYFHEYEGMRAGPTAMFVIGVAVSSDNILSGNKGGSCTRVSTHLGLLSLALRTDQGQCRGWISVSRIQKTGPCQNSACHANCDRPCLQVVFVGVFLLTRASQQPSSRAGQAAGEMQPLGTKARVAYVGDEAEQPLASAEEAPSDSSSWRLSVVRSAQSGEHNAAGCSQHGGLLLTVTLVLIS